jgi:lactoylglutathione lyase
MSQDPNAPERPKFREPFPIFSVANLKRSMAFYCDLLGFTPGFRWPAEGEPEFIVLSLDGSEIGLSTYRGAGEVLGQFVMEHGARGYELCILVDDIHAASDYLREHGVKELEPPSLRAWGEYAAYFADPDGNPIHLYMPPS